MAVLGGVFGDTVRERVQLNEDSVWHGGPIGRNKNFGGTAGIAEMLLHSHAGELHPPPALPKAWATARSGGE
ncbi:glycoside hydrolase family 95 protein [Paenibacillus sp. P26]|nr:glycoside hydrolase family 95 protein [Paenibacillus sp. P26]